MATNPTDGKTRPRPHVNRDRCNVFRGGRITMEVTRERHSDLHDEGFWTRRSASQQNGIVCGDATYPDWFGSQGSREESNTEPKDRSNLVGTPCR